MAIGFTILGFITTYLFMLNLILMILWRYNYDGKVCSGDHLNDEERMKIINADIRCVDTGNIDNKPCYLLIKGYVIDLAVKIICGSAVFIILSITCIAICYK